MSGVVEQIGRGFTGDTIRRSYYVHDQPTEADARAALLGYLADEELLVLSNLHLSDIGGEEDVKAGKWRVTCDWGARPAVGQSQFNFELSLQPVKIVVPIATTVFGPTIEPADVPKLIGDQRTADPPEGCEIFEPVFDFSETHYLSDALMTLTYRNTLGRLVGKVNNATFKGWEPGEVLARAVSGSKRGAEMWEVTFRFSTRENMTAATVCGIAGVNKKGWEYLWPYYERSVSGTTLVNNVTHIIVNQVFPTADFSQFGIGE